MMERCHLIIGRIFNYHHESSLNDRVVKQTDLFTTLDHTVTQQPLINIDTNRIGFKNQTKPRRFS
jgi:hypothetical protein